MPLLVWQIERNMAHRDLRNPNAAELLITAQKRNLLMDRVLSGEYKTRDRLLKDIRQFAASAPLRIVSSGSGRRLPKYLFRLPRETSREGQGKGGRAHGESLRRVDRCG